MLYQIRLSINEYLHVGHNEKWHGGSMEVVVHRESFIYRQIFLSDYKEASFF